MCKGAPVVWLESVSSVHSMVFGAAHKPRLTSSDTAVSQLVPMARHVLFGFSVNAKCPFQPFPPCVCVTCCWPCKWWFTSGPESGTMPVSTIRGGGEGIQGFCRTDNPYVYASSVILSSSAFELTRSPGLRNLRGAIIQRAPCCLFHVQRDE